MRKHVVLLAIMIFLSCSKTSYSQTFEDFGVLEAFREHDLNFNHIEILEKRYMTPNYSALVVRVATSDNWYRDMKEGKEFRELYGLFIVDNYRHKDPMILDFFDMRRFFDSIPMIRDVGKDYLVFPGTGSYEDLRWHAKYFVDLKDKRLVKKINFSDMSIDSIITYGDSVFFKARNYQGSIVIVLTKSSEYYDSEKYRFMGNSWKSIELMGYDSMSIDKNYIARRNGFTVREQNGDTAFYRLPLQDSLMIRKYLPDVKFYSAADVGFDMKMIPGNRVGNRIWFGNHYYAGEGSVGIGWIGYFDLTTRSYEIYYLDEVIPWSVRSIFADNTSVLAGLVCFSEYLYPGEGLVKFDINTQKVIKYPIKDVISAIKGHKGIYFLGSTNGFYVLEGDNLMHITIDFDINENYFIKEIRSF